MALRSRQTAYLTSRHLKYKRQAMHHPEIQRTRMQQGDVEHRASKDEKLEESERAEGGLNTNDMRSWSLLVPRPRTQLRPLEDWQKRNKNPWPSNLGNVHLSCPSQLVIETSKRWPWWASKTIMDLYQNRSQLLKPIPTLRRLSGSSAPLQLPSLFIFCSLCYRSLCVADNPLICLSGPTSQPLPRSVLADLGMNSDVLLAFRISYVLGSSTGALSES